MSQVTEQPQRIEVTAASKPIILARAVSKTYRMGESGVQVLRGIDLSVRQGEFLAIEGRSGSGKSTLLHILGALDSLDSGNVEFQGVDYTSQSHAHGRESFLRRLSRWLRLGWGGCVIAAIVLVIISASIFDEPAGPRKDWSAHLWYACCAAAGLAVLLLLAWILTLVIRAIKNRIHETPLTHLRNHDFGFVFQFYHLLPELTVLENATLTPMIGGSGPSLAHGRDARIARARQVLEELGMGHRLKHRPSQLSGGERQRVAIARALMNQPKVLFADEPTGNLDAETGGQIMAVLEALHRDQGQTIVMVTHDRTIARQADRVLVLKDGKLAG